MPHQSASALTNFSMGGHKREDLAHMLAKLADTYRMNSQRWVDEGGRAAESVRMVKAFAVYFAALDTRMGAAQPQSKVIPAVSRVELAAIGPHSQHLQAIVGTVENVADRFLMNDLEIVLWSLYLDRLEPFWLRLSAPQQALALLCTAYSMKAVFAADHLTFVPMLNEIVADFGVRYQGWLVGKGPISLAIPPVMLHARFSMFERFRE